MMFRLGHYDLISLMDKSLTERISHKIYRSSGTACKNNFFTRPGIKKILYCIPCALICLSSVSKPRLKKDEDSLAIE